jgi:hypothetical protein
VTRKISFVTRRSNFLPDRNLSKMVSCVVIFVFNLLLEYENASGFHLTALIVIRNYLTVLSPWFTQTRNF